MKKWIVLSCLTISLTACFKKEIPVPKPSIDAMTGHVELGSNYANQLFYDIETNTVLKKNNREIWDLGFECGATGTHIILNTARLMSAVETVETDILAVNSDAGLTYYYDRPSGDYDSIAFKNWQAGKVYIVNLGMNNNGIQLGKKKVKVLSVNASEYQIQFADLNSSSIKSLTIPKSDDLNFQCVSLTDEGSIQSIEPDKSKWDLEFTSFCHVYADGTPYSVTGALSNRFGVKVQEVSKSFADFSYSDIQEDLFKNRLNVIGFDWKVYDFDNGVYSVNSSRTFVIKTIEGKYYKLRFIDYYSDSGEKGAPKFEYKELIP